MHIFRVGVSFDKKLIKYPCHHEEPGELTVNGTSSGIAVELHPSRGTVLLVDANDRKRELLKSVLERDREFMLFGNPVKFNGYRVLTASSTNEAQGILSREKVDLILASSNTQDCFELASTRKENIPFILLSPEPPDDALIEKHKVSAVLSSSFKFSELTRAIDVALGHEVETESLEAQVVKDFDTTPLPTKTILIVDDDEKQRKRYGYHLAFQDYKVLQANNADEAQDILKREKVDLIVCEKNLPGIDGYELAKLRPQNIPFIITGLWFGEGANFKHLNIQGIFSKIKGPKDLIPMVERVLEIQGKKESRRRLERVLVFENMRPFFDMQGKVTTWLKGQDPLYPYPPVQRCDKVQAAIETLDRQARDGSPFDLVLIHNSEDSDVKQLIEHIKEKHPKTIILAIGKDQGQLAFINSLGTKAIAWFDFGDEMRIADRAIRLGTTMDDVENPKRLERVFVVTHEYSPGVAGNVAGWFRNNNPKETDSFPPVLQTTDYKSAFKLIQEQSRSKNTPQLVVISYYKSKSKNVSTLLEELSSEFPNTFIVVLMYDERSKRFPVENEMIQVIRDDELGNALEIVDKRIKEAAGVATPQPTEAARLEDILIVSDDKTMDSSCDRYKSVVNTWRRANYNLEEFPPPQSTDDFEKASVIFAEQLQTGKPFQLIFIFSSDDQKLEGLINRIREKDNHVCISVLLRDKSQGEYLEGKILGDKTKLVPWHCPVDELKRIDDEIRGRHK